MPIDPTLSVCLPHRRSTMPPLGAPSAPSLARPCLVVVLAMGYVLYCRNAVNKYSEAKVGTIVQEEQRVYNV